MIYFNYQDALRAAGSTGRVISCGMNIHFPRYYVDFEPWPEEYWFDN